jgi:hypothetical protein
LGGGDQRPCKPVEGVVEVGLEPDRGAEFGDRLLHLPQFFHGAAEVGVGLGAVGLGLDRGAEFGDRPRILTLAIQLDAADVMGLGIGRLMRPPWPIRFARHEA